MRYFSEVQRAFKYSDANIQTAFMEAVAGTPLLPRDLFLMGLSGRLIYGPTPSGKVIYSMQSRKDISTSLDIISQDKGTILVRGDDLWQPLATPVAGRVLTSTGPNGIPEWRDPQRNAAKAWEPVTDTFGSTTQSTGSVGAIIIPTAPATLNGVIFRFTPTLAATDGYNAQLVTLDATNKVTAIIATANLKPATTTLDNFQFDFPEPIELTPNTRYGLLLTRLTVAPNASFTFGRASASAIMPNLGLATVTQMISGAFNDVAIGQTYVANNTPVWFAAGVPGTTPDEEYYTKPEVDALLLPKISATPDQGIPTIGVITEWESIAVAPDDSGTGKSAVIGTVGADAGYAYFQHQDPSIWCYLPFYYAGTDRFLVDGSRAIQFELRPYFYDSPILSAKADLRSSGASNYTLTLADAGRHIRMTSSAANTLTVPPNSSVAFPIGTTLSLEQAGTGQTTITPGSGVTINASGAKLKTAARYAVANIRKVAADTWVAWGDLSA